MRSNFHDLIRANFQQSISYQIKYLMTKGLGLEISKTWFRDSRRPKKSTQWANFLIGFSGPRRLHGD